jgi:hypothetical protein
MSHYLRQSWLTALKTHRIDVTDRATQVSAVQQHLNWTAHARDVLVTTPSGGDFTIWWRN